MNFTLVELNIIAECMRMTATMILARGRLRKVDKVRIATIGIVLDKVTKEIERVNREAVESSPVSPGHEAAVSGGGDTTD